LLGFVTVFGLEFLESAFFMGGMVAIVALSFDHMLNHAGVPALVNRIPVMLGAFTVSAVSMRLVFAIAASAGVQLLDWGSVQGFAYNSMNNTRIVNGFLAANPALCIGIILFTFAASMVLGGIGGWLLARASLKLSPVLILASTYVLTDFGCVFGRNIEWLSGGTIGVYVPDFLAFTGDFRLVALGILVVAVIAVVYMLLGRLEASPWGRLVAAAADNPVTAESLGKDVVSLRGHVVFYTSGLMALAGTLYSFYLQYVIESPFHNWVWLIWPLMAVAIGGPGSRGRIILGTIVFYTIQSLIVFYKFELQNMFPFPVTYFQELFFSLIILVALTRLPKIMTRRRRLSIVGMVEDAAS